jgi:DNA-binding response OmpR family regulator
VNKKQIKHPADADTSHPMAEHEVLIVDDDKDTAGALGRLLSNAGFKPSTTHTGKSALHLARSNSFAAAIIDVHLPDINGLVLSMNLREILGHTAPILVVSGDTSMETINSLPHVGATHFFAKPISPSHLIKRLKDCLSTHS